ncbi:LamB/YcsF family protein [Dactylosporangium aurantiacum]|uniref:LamB/YcsF family protein n=1 Tax=Dactylosporangium aurantiacum TaxID=35754 RepID=A0A9Q9IG07_9ACTN|nr:5-oxoprolinase subunit PxpA [Dactylosporangium aurantiacum]MDG6101156.1 LamB/YcsF family protein [Dactylosporangium aurantiacum]UWZ54816.1 LamB/YcsF family protein [Dactylosporangium aurantiacum]
MDLNSDLGEGFGVWTLGDDEALLEIITSANVACGFHAGDPTTMRRVCARAADLGVRVGAQVSYNDLAGFGRRRIDVDPAVLTDELQYQIGALSAFGPVAYVKPHGALYNTAAVDPAHASAVVAAARSRDLPVLCQPGSALAGLAAEAGLRVVGEGFVDRGYLPDGRLVPRGSDGAVLTDVAVVVERAVRMARDGEVVAVDGTVLRLPFESLCVHGDTPGAVGMASAVRLALLAEGIQPTPFT